jgi:hypothetical protein
MIAAEAAAETPAFWPVAAANNSSQRLVHITVMQLFADLGDTDMMFNLLSMLEGDPDEATV